MPGKTEYGVPRVPLSARNRRKKCSRKFFLECETKNNNNKNSQANLLFGSMLGNVFGVEINGVSGTVNCGLDSPSEYVSEADSNGVL